MDTNKFFKELSERISNFSSFVILTITNVSGSVPRKIGAKMALFPDGSTIGTIGGGSLEDAAIKDAGKALEDKKSFSAILLSLGAFPKIDYPRVIWVGISQGSAEIKEIAQELEQRISQIGLPAEKKPFSSHITLGRVRSGLKREKLVTKLKEFQDQIKEGSKEFRIDRVILFKSTLTPQGPIYEELYSANLTTI